MLSADIKPVRKKVAPPMLRIDGIALDTERRLLIKGRQVCKLTPKECRLLKVLMTHAGKVLTRKFLMKEVWETDYCGDTGTLEVHVRWLREKIEEEPSSPRYLRTVRGVGYRFGVPDN